MVMARGFDGQSGAKSGDARDVHALLAFGHGAAEDDVVNFLGIEAGNARKRFLDGERGEIVGPRGAQGAFVGAAYGGADGGNDDGFWHDGPRFVELFDSRAGGLGKANARSSKHAGLRQISTLRSFTRKRRGFRMTCVLFVAAK